MTTIPSLLARQADQNPNSVALLAPDRAPLSYAQLLAQVNETCAALHAAGVRREDRAAVVLPNGPEMAVAFLSVACTAVCAPLNPDYRESEFDFYISDLLPKAIVVEHGVESPVLAVARNRNIPVIRLRPRLDQPAGIFALEYEAVLADRSAPAPPNPKDIALVLHTSGTTSRPKQVPLAHANLCCSADNIRRALELTAPDRCLNVMPLFHIHGLAAAVLASLSAGASVVCSPGFYAPRFFDWLAEFAPTWYTAVPTMHQAILGRAGERQIPTTLRFIRSSSAALPPQVLSGLERVFSVPVIEAYGMTEAAHQMASNPLPPAQRKPGSVGLAAGPEIAIMIDGQPAPAGATGEIVIRGPNVMSGYVANPEATKEAFWSGWFRTGDLGRLDDQNYLYINGRSKEIINRGGEKISPREIDEALLEHPAVAQALAFALPHPKLGEEPAAAAVLRSGSTASETELREFVSKRLSDFKVPRRIIFLDEIPKGPTGKPQRIGLAKVLGLNGDDAVLPETKKELQPPRTSSEKLVAELWHQVLGVVEIGIHDSFFDLGGDSMLAAQFLSRLAQFTGSAPPMMRLFDQPTVEQVAAWMDTNNAGESAPPLRRDQSATAPLSFAQQRFWFLDQYEPDTSAYVQASAMRLRGDLDVDRLRRAMDTVVERHEILRTSYIARDGVPSALVNPPREIAWKFVDVDSIEAINHLATTETRVRFNLERDLMIRPVLARIAPGDHVLLLMRHHIASDGWSAEIIFRELAALYEDGSLPELPVQYGDYARWQTERYSSGAFDREVDYWRQRLAGAAPLLALPLDRPRPVRQTFRGARESFTLPVLLTAQIAEMARANGATLFMALFAAFQALLARYSNAADIAVGCPVAGRGRVELESLTGLFMNTLVLRTDTSGHPSFRELLVRVRDVSLGAFSNQELPFEKLVEALQPARSLSYSPLFQVLFQLRNLPFAAPRFANLECEPLEVETGAAQFDLSLALTPANGALHGAFTYNTDLFDRDTAIRIVRHYRNLLAGVVADPAQKVSSIPILDPEERRQLLAGWNQSDRPLPSRAIHQTFKAQVDRRPDAIAVIDREGEISYAELNQAADRVAHRLRGLGIGPGSLVAVGTGRSRRMVAAVLGVLKTGAAYLPLDPQYPKDRLSFMLQDSRAAALVTEDSVRDRLPERLPETILIDSAETSPARPNAADVSLASTAYAIYTSGSTGAPKAVLVSHFALANLLEAMRAEISLSENDSVIAVTTLSFDIAAAEIFLPLISGGKVAIADRERQTDGRALAEFVDRVQPSWLQATPATWRMLIDSGWRGSKALTAVCGGEAMPRQIADALLERCARVFNVYGPTEATIWATIEQVRAGESAVPIGRPLANYRAYILDDGLAPVPQGVAGELFIGGAGVAVGYWQRPELTAARFLPDPFAGDPDARMYKTGDSARWLAGGIIEFLGRSDDQIKLRGFRIESGDVEAALAAHPDVSAAAVSVRDDALTAWCVFRKKRQGSGELRKFVGSRLPDYMVPTRFIALDSLPTLPNGKVDRRALASLEEPALRPSEMIEPSDDMERCLAAIWEELLGTRPVGLCDDFFEFGGHSLLAARAAARIEKEFGIQVPVAAIFEAPTIARMAEHLRGGARSSWPERVIPIQPSGSRSPFWIIGSGATFRFVAQNLHSDQPVFGVLFEDSDAAAFGPPYRLEAISTEIVRIIQTLQPRGPYQIGGHSVHGLYAYECARQLTEAGETVNLLALFDTSLPVGVRLKFPARLRFRVHVEAARWLIERNRYSEAKHFVSRTAKDVLGRWLPAQPAKRPAATHPETSTASRVSIDDVLKSAADAYQPRPYPHRVLFLQARDMSIAPHYGSQLGWQDYAVGEFWVRSVPGGHESLIERANAAAVAQILDAALSRSAAQPDVHHMATA